MHFPPFHKFQFLYKKNQIQENIFSLIHVHFLVLDCFSYQIDVNFAFQIKKQIRMKNKI
jgi:hypothetical protein